MKTTLVIPTLNEFECMEKIMPRIKKEWVDEILIVDGGSTDGTVEYAKKHNYPVFAPKVKGLSAQLLEAFKVATGDVIVLFSPDGNSIPELIPSLIKKMKEGHDMVIVSRYMAGAKSYDDDFFTRIGNFLFTSTVNLFFRAKYTDTLVIFRAFKKNVIEKIKFDVRGDVDLQLSIRCAKKKLKVTEIPGDEPKRVGGERKISIIGTGFQLLIFLIKELFTR
jgi:glycosyltransferase involved in cell wall biosynthesis